jgi:predicted nuclease of predicted toxin-antitoxin system
MRHALQWELRDDEVIKFYTDVHVPREAVRQLQRKGVNIIHCSDIGMADAEDEEHLLYAIETGRVMVSCDDDFERLHAAYLRKYLEHTGIVYFRMFDQCQDIGLIVREILFLHEAADYETDLYNQIWRTSR